MINGGASNVLLLSAINLTIILWFFFFPLLDLSDADLV